MSLPFKYKTSFKEVFQVLSGKDGKLSDIKEFHGYMKTPFNGELIDACPKPLIQDSFFSFLVDAQKDSGVSYDDMLWNFVEKFIKCQIFDGKDTMEMKPLRTFYDPLFKSLRQEPEALWSKYCGSSASSATVSGLKSLVKDLNTKGTAPLPELLKAALPKNKPLKPAPTMRYASPKKVVSSTPPPPSSPSQAAAQAKKDSPAPSATGSKQSPTPSSSSPAKKDEKPSTPAAAVDDKKSVASDAAPSATENDTSSVSGTSSAPPPAEEPSKKVEQVPPAAATALANASGDNRPPPLQPTALGSTISKASSSTPQQQSSQQPSPSSAAVIAPKLGQQQQQQQQQQPALGVAQSAPLGIPAGSPSITVPPQIAAAVADIDQRHERLRAEIEAQATALLSADNLLSVVAQRMAQVKPLPHGGGSKMLGHSQTAATDKFRRDLDSITTQMETFCASVGAELDGFRRHAPQYVADLGRGIAAGKALEHPPNEDFGELRLNALLAAVRKDQEEVMVKERAAQRLELIQEQEEALKREIAALEQRFQAGGGGGGQPQHQQQHSAGGGGGRSASSSQQVGVATPLQKQQQQQMLMATRQQQKMLAQQSTPPAASGTFVHSSDVVKKQQQAAAAMGQSAVSSPALSIAQRIAARVTDQQQRGHGTANYAMPATSGALHAVYRGY